MNTTYFLNQIMGNVFQTKTTPAIPENYYIGLSLTEPAVDGSNVTEPSRSGTGYARVVLSDLSEPYEGMISNDSPISFDESITDWGKITHYVVYDQIIDGNLLFYGPFSVSRSVEPNTTILIRAGELQILLNNKDE